MTPEEYTEKLQTLYGLQSDVAEYTILPAAAELLIEIKQRIVNDGKNTADGNIGDYSTKPMYVEREQFFKPGAFIAQGKNNYDGNTIGDRIIETNKVLVFRNATHQAEGVFVTGRQTTISKGGGKKTPRFSLVKGNYQERKTMYLKDGYKQLRDIQGLRTDIMNFKYRGDLINSYQMQKISQAVLLGLTDEKSATKREKLEERFGPVFYATAAEIATYSERVNFLFRRITVNTLDGVEPIPTVEYI